MAKILLILCIICAWSDNICHKFGCKPLSDVYTADTCAVFDRATNYFNLNECPHGYTCNIGANPYPLGNYTCSPTPPRPAYDNYPGEICDGDEDCQYGDCESGICKGIGEGGSCHDNLECDPGMRCLNDSCQPLLAVGATNCTLDYDCFGSACMNNTCIDYFSLESGTPIPYESCSTFNETVYCQQGQCTPNDAQKTAQCSQAFKTISGIPPVACTNDSQCIGKNNELQYSQGSCNCGYNTDGTGYCTAFLQDLSGEQFITNYDVFLKGDATKCNTERRYSLDCWKSYQSDNQALQLLKAYYAYRYTPQITNNDACVQEILTTYYYDL